MNQLRELRQKKGMTQARFAKWLNIPQRTYEKWETGERVPPQWVIELIKDKCTSNAIKTYFYCYRVDEEGKTGVYRTEYEENVNTWKKNAKSKVKWIEVHKVVHIYDV